MQPDHELGALLIDHVGHEACVLQGRRERDPVAWIAQEAAVVHEIHIRCSAEPPQPGHAAHQDHYR
uniref:Uncharacterized protein n=1 Tax=Arundo donax TaxID=35708 RepID=A0A0A9CKH2_ARUDO